MAKRQSYTLAGQHFPTKQSVVEAVQRIIRSTPDGAAVEGQDRLLLLDLFSRHTTADHKFGDGIDRIEVRPNPMYPGVQSRGFWLVRVDGSETDISYRECLSPASPRQKLTAALRMEVIDQVVAFKRQAFAASDTLPCAVTGEPVTIDAAHVDHFDPTFDEMVDAWLYGRDLSPEAIDLTDRIDGQIGNYISDRNLAASFADYHRCCCQLRVVSKQANLSVLRRGIPRKVRGGAA